MRPVLITIRQTLSWPLISHECGDHWELPAPTLLTNWEQQRAEFLHQAQPGSGAAVAGAYYGKRVASPIMSRVWVAGQGHRWNNDSLRCTKHYHQHVSKKVLIFSNFKYFLLLPPTNSLSEQKLFNILEIYGRENLQDLRSHERLSLTSETLKHVLISCWNTHRGCRCCGHFIEMKKLILYDY